MARIWPVLEEGIPCSDAVGTILAVDSHVRRFAVGERVCPVLDQKAITSKQFLFGGHGENCIVRSGWVIHCFGLLKFGKVLIESEQVKSKNENGSAAKSTVFWLRILSWMSSSASELLIT
jgi:NADPH:quinone reductase-like Zn-dependent oxidoreductase